MMSRLEKLREANGTLPLTIYSIHDPEFRAYGRVIEDFDTAPIIEAAREGIPLPPEGSRYLPALECIDASSDAEIIRSRYMGQTDAQLGICLGHSERLNALEWHTSSELDIGVTDMVLFLGDLRDLEDRCRYDSSKIRAFYLGRGEMVELYATTLHFCPCEVSKDGFSCIVVLPRGTNTPLEEGREHSDRLLWAKNKWLIAHNENTALTARGVVAGISGENYTINKIETKEHEDGY